MSRARDLANVADDVSTGTVVTTASPSLGRRNRIINGSMVIDQRNGGASGTANGVYTLDRWNFGSGVSGKLTYGQNYNSLTPPIGFTNYMGFKTTTAHTLGASEFFLFTQAIEGYNVADLDFGKSSAKTITLSFWVNSSLTGTFGVVLSNSAQDRCYPATYTISSANTWEKKSITVVGDTTGTWLTTNGKGLSVMFGLGVGSTFNGTADSWQSATYLGTTGATSIVGTLNATWNITGVQLEVGSVATPFEHRSYGEELALCQRYYYRTPNGAGANYQRVALGFASNSTTIRWNKQLPVTMRAHPTLTTSGNFVFYEGANLSASGFILDSNQANDNIFIYGTGTVSGGTAYRPGHISANNDNDATFIFDSEL